MSQIIELSNGHELEFPDGMSDEQMHAAIQKEYPAPSKQWTPGHNFFQKEGQEGEEAQKQFKGLGSYLAKPSTWGNIALGAAKGFGNLPSDTANLAIGAGNWLNNTNAPYVPEPFDIKNEAQQAGSYASGFLPVVGAAGKTGEILSGLMPTLKRTSETGKTQGILSQLMSGTKNTISEARGKEIPELERQVTEAQKAHELAMAQEEQAKGYANIETGVGDENRARYKLHGKQRELEELEQPEASNLPVQSSVESGNNQQRATEAHQQALNQANEAEHAVSQHLNRGAAHGLRVGTHVKEVVKDTENTLKRDYKKFAEEVAVHPVEMPKISKINIKNPVLKNLREIAPSSADNLGEQALIKYKDFRNERFNLRQQLKSGKLSAQEADDISKALTATQKIENEAKSALVKAFGEDFVKLNSGYSDFYKLRGNTTVRQAVKHGKIKGNLIEKFSGSEEGQDLLRDIIRRNPEMMKNVVGQQYANRPHELHDVGELAQEYIGQMPELQQLLGRHWQAVSRVHPAENAMSQAQEIHRNVISAENKAHESVAKKQNAAVETAAKRKKLQGEIDNLDKHIKELEKSSKNKKRTLKEKVIIENQIKEAKEKRDEARWKIGKILTYGGIGGLVTHYSNIGRLSGSKD